MVSTNVHANSLQTSHSSPSYLQFFNLQVKLRDALVSSLQFSRARDAELAWVDGQLHMNASESQVGLLLEDGEVREDEEGHEKMETDQSGKEEPVDTVPVLEQLQLTQVKASNFYYLQNLGVVFSPERERLNVFQNHELLIS